MNTRRDRKPTRPTQPTRSKAKKSRRKEQAEELVFVPDGLARRLRRRLGSARRDRRRTTDPTLARYLRQALRPAFGAKRQVN